MREIHLFNEVKSSFLSFSMFCVGMWFKRCSLHWPRKSLHLKQKLICFRIYPDCDFSFQHEMMVFALLYITFYSIQIHGHKIIECVRWPFATFFPFTWALFLLQLNGNFCGCWTLDAVECNRKFIFYRKFSALSKTKRFRGSYNVVSMIRFFSLSLFINPLRLWGFFSCTISLRPNPKTQWTRI